MACWKARKAVFTHASTSRFPLFVYSPLCGLIQSKHGHIPQGFLGGGCRSTMLWPFQDVPCVLKATGGWKEIGAGEAC